MPRHTQLSIPESDPRTCSRGARVNALALVPFFAGLDHDRLHGVDGRAAIRGVEAGEAVFLADHRAERLYVVASGAVKLTSPTPDANESCWTSSGRARSWGPAGAGGETYAEDAWALTAGCVLAFTGVQFDAILDEHPSVARSALAAVGRRLRTAQERIERPASASASVRIASTLLVLAARLGIDQGERVLVDVPLAREDLASQPAPEHHHRPGHGRRPAHRRAARWPHHDDRHARPRSLRARRGGQRHAPAAASPPGTWPLDGPPSSATSGSLACAIGRVRAGR